MNPDLAEIARLSHLLAEARAEVSRLDVEVERMRPVLEASIAMRHGHEGCVTDPPCGSCFRCEFDRAVDAATRCNCDWRSKDPDAGALMHAPTCQVRASRG